MHTLLSNRHVWWFTLVYLGSIGVLIAAGRPLEDVIGAFLILGVLLPLVALAACARMPRPPPPAPWRDDDGALLRFACRDGDGEKSRSESKGEPAAHGWISPRAERAA